MKWGSKVLSADQMLSSCMCFFKIIPSLSWIFVLPATLISIAFATYLVPGFGFVSIFLYTSLVFVFSTIFCSCPAPNDHKAICVVGETKSSMNKSSDQNEDVTEEKEEEEEGEGEGEEDEEEEMEEDNNGGEEKTSYFAEESSDQREDILEAREEEEDEDNNGDGSGFNNNNYSTRSPDSASNSESDQEMSTSEESDELDCYWPLDRCVDGSDGSISDEESLIEIALPTEHFSLKDQHHQQHSLMMMPELLAEYNFDMNEEDNLIEIDISMGSIKSYPSRSEIQA